MRFFGKQTKNKRKLLINKGLRLFFKFQFLKQKFQNPFVHKGSRGFPLEKKITFILAEKFNQTWTI